MLFAMNYSPEAVELLEEGRIEVDLFKCTDWEEITREAQAHKPIYVHYDMSIGVGQVPTWDFARIEHWLKTSDTRFVNCHIAPTNANFPRDISVDALSNELAQEVDILVQHFGAERVIIENTPYDERTIKHGYLQQGSDSRLLNSIVEQTGCGFLLDVSHAILSADYQRHDAHAYLDSLPVHAIKELHVTGIGLWQNGDYGDHVPMEAKDWERLDWVLAQMQTGKWATPQVMAFEHGGIGRLREMCGSDKKAMAEQVPRLYDLAHRFDKVTSV